MMMTNRRPRTAQLVPVLRAPLGPRDDARRDAAARHSHGDSRGRRIPQLFVLDVRPFDGRLRQVGWLAMP